MQILVSVVNGKERKMLGAPFAAGTVGSLLLCHGQTTLPAYREHLTYCYVTSTEQDKPVSFPERGKINREEDRWRCGQEIGEEANAAL
jgi:hypothetical protein